MATGDPHGRRMEAARRSTAAAMLAVPRTGSERETWLCRSTIGAGSEADEDELWSETSDVEDGDRSEECEDKDNGAVPVVTREEKTCLAHVADPQKNGESVKKSKHQSRGRRLTLGNHLDAARSHVLRKAIPPLPTPIDITAKPCLNDPAHAKKKRRQHSHFLGKPARDEAASVKKKKNEGSEDHHLTIYMDYEREPGFGKTPKPKRHCEVYVVRHTWSVHVALFLSTACVHCISFNVSPGLRRLFGIDALPVGLGIVVAWTLLGLVNCIGACLSGIADRVTLLRRLSWLWLSAVVVLQSVKVVPFPAWIANTVVAVGYSAAVIAHGLLLPNLIALGAEMVTADATSKTLAMQRKVFQHPMASVQHSVDIAMGAFITWAFAAMLAASSLVQAFYFAAVNLDLPTTQDVFILRGQRSVLITLFCAVLLLALLVTFLFQSRRHASPAAVAAQATQSSDDAASKTWNDAVQPRNKLERKLARGELASFSEESSRVAAAATATHKRRLGLYDWLRLGRHSTALLALAFFALLLLLAVATALLAHLVTPAKSAASSSSSSSSSSSPSSSSALVHLVIFAVLFVGWLMTMLLSASQLSPTPRDKLYAKVDGAYVAATSSRPPLPSREQLFVVVALLCLASAAAFAAFVRAQLYSTMFVQTCQLRRPHSSGVSVLFDPNILGAWVGLASVLLLPTLHFVLLRSKKSTRHRERVSAVHRVTIGVLLYLAAIFLSSVVELYRRDTRLRSIHVVNPEAAHCTKTQPSSLAALWSLPHLVVLALADALFRVGAAEEAYALTAPLDWLGVAQAVLSFADSIGYALALALSKTLSAWLYRVQTSDLVLLLLMITAIASLSYALTKRLADHVQASRRCQRLRQQALEDEKEQDDMDAAKGAQQHDDDDNDDDDDGKQHGNKQDDEDAKWKRAMRDTKTNTSNCNDDDTKSHEFDAVYAKQRRYELDVLPTVVARGLSRHRPIQR